MFSVKFCVKFEFRQFRESHSSSDSQDLVKKTARLFIRVCAHALLFLLLSKVRYFFLIESKVFGINLKLSKIHTFCGSLVKFRRLQSDEALFTNLIQFQAQ